MRTKLKTSTLGSNMSLDPDAEGWAAPPASALFVSSVLSQGHGFWRFQSNTHATQLNPPVSLESTAGCVVLLLVDFI